MTTYLSNGTIQIDIAPEWETTFKGAVLRADSRTIGGLVSTYKWGDYEAWDVPLTYVPSSDVMQINEWWETQQQLTFYFDETSYDVYILGNCPFQSPAKPYYDSYNGTLNLQKK